MIGALLLNLDYEEKGQTGLGGGIFLPTKDIRKAQEEILGLYRDKRIPKPVKKAVKPVVEALKGIPENLDLSGLSELIRLLQMQRLDLMQALGQVDVLLVEHRLSQTILAEITVLLNALSDDEDAILAILLSE